MGLFITLIVVAFVVLLIFGWMHSSAIAEETANLDKSIREEFEPDELFISASDQSFIGIKFDSGQFIIGNTGFRKAYLFSEVVALEIVKDGASITSTNRGSQALGAAVGGIALGGVGLLAGALSGSKRTKERVKELALKITVEDHVSPMHRVTFLNWPGDKGLEASDSTVKTAADQLDRFHAHLTVGMRKADRAASATHSLPAPADYVGSVARLWDLHQAGALTLDEFQQQKALLGAPPA